MCKWVRAAVLVGLLGLTVQAAHAQSFVINGKVVKLQTIAKAGKTYVDVGAFARALGASITYDKAKKQYTVTISRAQSGAQGTTQLEGGWGEFGKEYTLGKSDPMNFALRSAEFTVSRVRVGEDVDFPKAGEKFLVLHYTFHNPQRTECRVLWSTFDFTAVDATNTNREYSQNVGQELNSQPLDMDLKPAQKIDVYTYIAVPASGPVPKLIVKSSDDLVIRYDLRGKVKPLAAPLADPADPSGASALEEVPAQMNVYYPTGVYDVQLVSAAYAQQPMLGDAPGSGMRYLVFTFMVKNQAARSESLDWGVFLPKLRTQDGDNIEWNENLLHGSQDESFEMELDPGQEARVRIYFEVRNGSFGKTLFIQEDPEGRRYAFDVSGVK